MHIDADCDDVNQHNKIDIELNEYNEYIFANSNQVQSNNDASSCSSFENEADKMELYDIEDIEYHVPDPKARPQNTPITILAANTIGCCQSRKILRVLLDTGSEVTLISRAVVPDAAMPKQTSSLKTVSTLAGTLMSNQVVSLRDIRLPEFDSNRKIESKKCLIFDQPCQYDMILGSDFLAQVKIDISYKNKCVSWFGNTIPLRNKRDLMRQDFDDLVECIESLIGEDDLGDDWMES